MHENKSLGVHLKRGIICSKKIHDFASISKVLVKHKRQEDKMPLKSLSKINGTFITEDLQEEYSP